MPSRASPESTSVVANRGRPALRSSIHGHTFHAPNLGTELFAGASTNRTFPRPHALALARSRPPAGPPPVPVQAQCSTQVPSQRSSLRATPAPRCGDGALIIAVNFLDARSGTKQGRIWLIPAPYATHAPDRNFERRGGAVRKPPRGANSAQL